MDFHRDIIKAINFRLQSKSFLLEKKNEKIFRNFSLSNFLLIFAQIFNQTII